jgi:hypothetical protein
MQKDIYLDKLKSWAKKAEFYINENLSYKDIQEFREADNPHYLKAIFDNTFLLDSAPNKEDEKDERLIPYGAKLKALKNIIDIFPNLS